MKRNSPYENLASHHFWRLAVAQENVLTTTNLWRKKIDICLEDTIVSAGSCFAQHISRRLVKSGYQFLDVEPPPQQLPAEQHTKFGFSTYSARYGNIYTAAQLIELAEESIGLRPQLDFSWEKLGRFYDPLRPNVEPNGLISHEEVKFHRQHHLKQVRRMLESCNVFVFTLGLTEAWICKRSGRTLPTAPGTVAGNYCPDFYEFKNFTHSEIKADFTKFMELVWSLQSNRSCRFLLTVSPVPLAATATNHHVLVATTYSKSTLRSVAGELYDEYPEVDYFPSYEIITSPWSRGLFYEPDLRNVASAGVDAAMRVFFLEHNLSLNENINFKPNQVSNFLSESEDDAVVCEEALLERFSK
jgi:hypothetical protein